MKKLSLNAKIFAIIGLLVGLSVFILVQSLSDLGTINAELIKIVDSTAQKIRLGGRISQRVIQISRAEKNMILATEDNEIKEYSNEIQTLKKEIQESIDLIRDLLNDANKEKLKLFQDHLAKYYSDLDRIYEFAIQNTNTKAGRLSRREGAEAFEKYVSSIDRFSEQVGKETGESSRLMEQLSQFKVDSYVLLTAERDLILSISREAQEKALNLIKKTRTSLEQRLKNIGRLANGNLSSSYDRLEETWLAWFEIHEDVVKLGEINSNTRAFEISSGTARQSSDAARQLIREIVQFNEDSLAEDKASSSAQYEKTRNSLIIFSSTGILAAIGLAFFVLLNLSQQINRIILSLRNASTEVANASLQLSSSAQELSNMSTEQAGSIEETSSSLEEISGMIDNNLSNTRETVNLMKTVCDGSKEGNQLMGVVEDSMEKIHKSNEQIKELVKIISNIGEKTQVMDEIVFQTKLLSFNASVEAERAGEHGRGFAVVAQEVGNLAGMSGRAAQEIAQIVKHSIKEAEQITENNKHLVDKGVEYVKQTSVKLREILSTSEAVASRAQQVLTASQEQSSGVKQINTAIGQLDKATQENAASAEETASTSEELSSQTETLAAVVRDLTLTVKGSSSEADLEVKRRAAPIQTKKAKNLHSSDAQHPGKVYKMDHFKGKSNFTPSETHTQKVAVGAESFGSPSQERQDQDEAWDRL